MNDDEAYTDAASALIDELDESQVSGMVTRALAHGPDQEARAAGFSSGPDRVTVSYYRQAMTVYALVINDRHVDTEVRLFADPQRASAELIDLARDNEWEIDVPTPSGWLVSCHNGRESDNAHVVAVEIET